MASFNVSSDFLKLVNLPDRKKQDFINYSANDFLELRASLVDYLKAVYPLDYQNFSESDLGVMLTELNAYTGAVTSMKSDMIANEHFLRTVKSRRNLGKLLELIGVKLKGPTSSSARLQVAIVGSKTVNPATFSPVDRVFTIISNEDGAPVNYTIYKLDSESVIEDITSNGSITFETADIAVPWGNGVDNISSRFAAVEGRLVTQAGTFNTNDQIKTIVLTEGPVAESSVDMFVESVSEGANGVYREVPKLFSSSGATDKVFEIVYDDNFGATIIFGDGYIGVSPPQDSTFFVSYRVGGGTRGNIRAEAINIEIQENTNADTYRVENVTAATGGSDAETVEHAKKYAPYTFKRQDRVVTLEDYITFANTFFTSLGSVGKAIATTRDAYASANVIDVYLLEKASQFQLQKMSPVNKQSFLSQIESKKMLTDQIVVNDGLIRTLDLVISIRIDKELRQREDEIKNQVAFEVLNFFDVDNFDFGKTFVLGELARRIFEIQSIRFATIDNVKEDITVNFNEIIQLNNVQINVIEV